MTVEVLNSDTFFTATIRKLGMKNAEEYNASGMDCRDPIGWKSDTVLPQVTKLEKNNSPAAPVPPKPGPFSKLEMGGYLDAIYNDDLAHVRHLDDQYLGAMRRTVSGGFGNNPIWQKIISAMQLDDASLMIPTVRTYLENYDSVYKRCLRKDAVTYTLTSTRKNGYGTVIGQRSSNYTVNREFEQAFKETADTGVSTGLQELSNPVADAGYGSPIAKIQKGTRELMAAYPCDAPVIRQFERGLLQILSQMKEKSAQSKSQSTAPIQPSADNPCMKTPKPGWCNLNNRR